MYGRFDDSTLQKGVLYPYLLLILESVSYSEKQRLVLPHKSIRLYIILSLFICILFFATRLRALPGDELCHIHLANTLKI